MPNHTTSNDNTKTVPNGHVSANAERSSYTSTPDGYENTSNSSRWPRQCLRQSHTATTAPTPNGHVIAVSALFKPH